MKRVSISENVIVSLLNYVATKPYSETAQLINSVNEDIQIIEEVKKVTKPVKKDK